MNKTGAAVRVYWDARAENYPRPFAADILPRSRRMLRILRGLGADFAGRKVLDIGCGTGVYSLPLAAEARSVLGVDISPEMLRVFRAERIRRGIKNASCFRCSWKGLPVGKVRGRFDVSFASMTLAIKGRADVLKMEAAARERCAYIGWAGERRNPVMEKVYRAHGLKYSAPHGSEEVLAALRALGRRPKVRYMRDRSEKSAPLEAALREIAVSLRGNGVRMDEPRTREILRKHTRRGKVRQTISGRKVLATWPVPGAASSSDKVNGGGFE